MKIHTNSLNLSVLEDAAQFKIPGGDVTFHLLGTAGSRSHARAYDVALRGHGSQHTRPPNTGITGAASGERAATWDD